MPGNESVTANVQCIRIDDTPAVTCHKCDRAIAAGDPIVWEFCWCGEITTRSRRVYAKAVPGSRPWSVSPALWIGPGPCHRTPQPFCADCRRPNRYTEYEHPRGGTYRSYTRHWGRVCEVCHREFFVHESIHGTRRRYCSDVCHNQRRAHVAREKRRASRADVKYCPVCGECFEPTRSDATYDKPACRQKAYRQRKAFEEEAA